jgi:hypothetical protein
MGSSKMKNSAIYALLTTFSLGLACSSNPGNQEIKIYHSPSLNSELDSQTVQDQNPALRIRKRFSTMKLFSFIAIENLSSHWTPARRLYGPCHNKIETDTEPRIPGRHVFGSGAAQVEKQIPGDMRSPAHSKQPEAAPEPTQSRSAIEEDAETFKRKPLGARSADRCKTNIDEGRDDKTDHIDKHFRSLRVPARQANEGKRENSSKDERDR